MRILQVWIQYEDDRGQHMRPVNIEDLEQFGVAVKAVIATSEAEKKAGKLPHRKREDYGQA
jgi:hypothetical protein